MKEQTKERIQKLLGAAVLAIIIALGCNSIPSNATTFHMQTGDGQHVLMIYPDQATLPIDPEQTEFLVYQAARFIVHPIHAVEAETFLLPEGSNEPVGVATLELQITSKPDMIYTFELYGYSPFALEIPSQEDIVSIMAILTTAQGTSIRWRVSGGKDTHTPWYQATLAELDADE